MLTTDEFLFDSGFEVADVYKQNCDADPASYSADEQAIASYEEQKSFENYVDFLSEQNCQE